LRAPSRTGRSPSSSSSGPSIPYRIALPGSYALAAGAKPAPANLAPMLYAIVQDVPTSWAHYPALAAAIGDPVPDELILHLAGPTDEGFRTIEVWETRHAWERCRVELAGLVPPGLIVAPPTLRMLEALTAIGRIAYSRTGVPRGAKA
jgi:hypothetical protein